MRLTTTTQISLDGVAQGPGGPDEDRSGGFERGGWGRGRPDAEVLAFIVERFQRADAFLFGRHTYELFARYWGAMADAEHPIAAALNTRPKYVVSGTLTEPRWAGTTVLTGDVAAAIAELKTEPQGELQVHGSCALVRWLLQRELIDELNLLLVPVIVGQGRRLFPETGPDTALDLIGSRSFPRGAMHQVYRPTGRPSYAPAG